MLLDIDAGVPSLTLDLLDISASSNDLVATAPAVGPDIPTPRCRHRQPVKFPIGTCSGWHPPGPPRCTRSWRARHCRRPDCHCRSSLLLIAFGLVLLRPALNGNDVDRARVVSAMCSTETCSANPRIRDRVTKALALLWQWSSWLLAFHSRGVASRSHPACCSTARHGRREALSA